MSCNDSAKHLLEQWESQNEFENEGNVFEANFIAMYIFDSKLSLLNVITILHACNLQKRYVNKNVKYHILFPYWYRQMHSNSYTNATENRMINQYHTKNMIRITNLSKKKAIVIRH